MSDTKQPKLSTARGGMQHKQRLSMFDLATLPSRVADKEKMHPSTSGSSPPTACGPGERVDTGAGSSKDDATLVAERMVASASLAMHSVHACATCGMMFDELQHQREHFKSDWHRANIKLRLSGKECLSQESFEIRQAAQRLGAPDLEQSSDHSTLSSDESTDTQDSSDTGNPQQQNLGAKKSKSYRGTGGGLMVEVDVSAESEDPDYATSQGDVALAYEALVKCIEQGQSRRQQMDEIDDGSSPQLTVAGISRPSDLLSIVILCGGGYFAGAVLKGNSIATSKTFHRYVVRRKQGGRQAVADQAGGGAAISAGANMRRQNEIRLQQEIDELLQSWSNYVRDAHIICVYAPGRVNKAAIFGQQPKLNKKDKRLCKIPMNVSRPTLTEALRVFKDLTSVIIVEKSSLSRSSSSTGVVEAENGRIAQNSKVGSASNQTATLFPPSLLEKIQQKQQPSAWLPLSKAVRKSDLVLLNAVVDEGGAEMVHVRDTVGTCLLHVAAAAGAWRCIEPLVDWGVDPDWRDDKSRSSFTLCRDKETRDAFRRARAKHEEAFDWSGAGVPVALTEEMQAQQKAKIAAKRAKAKARKMAAETKQKTSGTHVSGKSSSQPEIAAGADVRLTSATGDTQQQDQMRQRLARLAAIERRLQGEDGNNDAGLKCSFCGAGIRSENTAFTRLEFSYCSTRCVNAHKAVLGR